MEEKSTTEVPFDINTVPYIQESKIRATDMIRRHAEEAIQKQLHEHDDFNSCYGCQHAVGMLTRNLASNSFPYVFGTIYFN